MNEVTSFGKNRRPNGAFLFTDKMTGKETSFHSIQCVHCGKHDQYVPGSGRQRGWCMKCMGVLCFNELCLTECVNKDAQIDILEGNRKALARYGHTQTARELISQTTQNAIERLERQYGKSMLFGGR